MNFKSSCTKNCYCVVNKEIRYFQSSKLKVPDLPALLSAPKKLHLFTHSTLALLCAATYKIHISNTINTIVELYIDYSSKISYRSS